MKCSFDLHWNLAFFPEIDSVEKFSIKCKTLGFARFA